MNCLRRRWTLSSIVGIVVILVFIYWCVKGVPTLDWTRISDFFGISEYRGPVLQPNQVFQRGKTFWDFLELIIVPFTLSMVVLWFNRVERKKDEKTTLERNQDTVLREYFDRMTVLILEKGLLQADKKSELSILSSVITKAVLTGLDGYRKGLILKFLYESNLIGKQDKKEAIIDLEGANFSGAIVQNSRLCEALLSGVNLDGVDFTKSNLSVRQRIFVLGKTGVSGHGAFLIGSSLRKACLQEAVLTNIILDGAILIDADLRKANLQGAYIRTRGGRTADFERANLEEADLTNANLLGAINFDKANTSKTILTGAVMPDGKIHK